MEPVIDCPLDMTDTAKLPIAAMTPQADIRETDFVQWNEAKVKSDKPFTAQVILASGDDFPFTKKIVIIPSIQHVKVTLTFVGKEKEDGAEKTMTIYMPETTTPNEHLQVPSSDQTILPYLSQFSFNVSSESTTPQTLTVKLHLEACLHAGEFNITYYVYNYITAYYKERLQLRMAV